MVIHSGYVPFLRPLFTTKIWAFAQIFVARQGFEPRYTDSESAVLPLDDLAIKVIILPARNASQARLAWRAGHYNLAMN